jgi:hypothetical protein
MSTKPNRNIGTAKPATSIKETCDAVWKTIVEIENPDAKRAMINGLIRGLQVWVPIMAREGKNDGVRTIQEMITRAESELQKLPPAGLPFAGNN